MQNINIMQKEEKKTFKLPSKERYKHHQQENVKNNK